MKTEANANQSGVSGGIDLMRIKPREKFSYLLAVMASNPLLTLIGTYLMIFYTDIVKLNPIAVGTLFLLARIMDGISDPIMGYLLDHMPRTKMGKFRFQMFFGTIICCINFLLLWFGPAWSSAGKLFIAYVTYLLIGFTYDIMDIAKNSLLPAMTSSTKERSSLGMLMALGTVLSSVLVSVAAPMILAADGSNMNSYAVLILVVTAAVFIFGTLGALGVKERVIPVDQKEKHSVKDYTKILIQKPILATYLFSFLFSIANFVGGAVNAFFYTYVMNDIALLGTVSLSIMVGLLPGIFFSRVITKLLGNKRVMVISSIVSAAFLALRIIDPVSIPLIFIATIGGGFILGVLQPVAQVISANNIDYAEYHLNYRSEAAVASISTFISKVGNGIAGALPGYVLGLTGYIANSKQQPISVINGIIIIAIGVPIVFYLLAALAFGTMYKLGGKELQDLESALNERRAANTEMQ